MAFCRRFTQITNMYNCRTNSICKTLTKWQKIRPIIRSFYWIIRSEKFDLCRRYESKIMRLWATFASFQYLVAPLYTMSRNKCKLPKSSPSLPFTLMHFTVYSVANTAMPSASNLWQQKWNSAMKKRELGLVIEWWWRVCYGGMGEEQMCERIWRGIASLQYFWWLIYEGMCRI